MTAKEEIKRQLNHLRNYEDLTYEALRTLKIIEDKLALMEVEIKEQAIADHEAGVCEWKVDKAENWSAIPSCYRLYEWVRIGGKDTYCRFCGRKIKRV